MLGATGSAMIFICLLALTGILTLCLLAYVARCVLVVVEATAAGADRVQWPEEGYIDWIVQSLSLVGLAVVLLAPAGILGALLGMPSMLSPGPVLWLLFPIGALSSLSAEMRWVFFRPVIATRMIKLLPWTLLFYACTAVVLSLALMPWYVAVWGGRLPLLLLAAPLTAAMVLIYARLLGQLGWRITQLGPLAPEKHRKAGWQSLSSAHAVPPHIPLPVPKAESEAEPDALFRVPQSPTGLLELENVAPYELARDNEPPQPRREPPVQRLRKLDPEEEDAQIPYGMAEPPRPNPTVNTEALLQTLPRSFVEPDAQQQGDNQAPSLVSVIGFPFYSTTLVPWIILTCGFGVVGLLTMQLVQSAPG
jgi:hypothetical protein